MRKDWIGVVQSFAFGIERLGLSGHGPPKGIHRSRAAGSDLPDSIY